MKQLKSFMLLVSMALIIGAVLIGACNAQETTNYLKVKGKIIGSNATDIQVFEYNDVSCEWEEIHRKVKKSKYFMRLATDKDYKVFFTADNGYIKSLHIHSGDPGMWIKPLDVDFNNTGNLNAMMYQNDEQTDYEVRVIPYNAVLLTSRE